jgi:hypothetical protein
MGRAHRDSLAVTSLRPLVDANRPVIVSRAFGGMEVPANRRPMHHWLMPIRRMYVAQRGSAYNVDSKSARWVRKVTRARAPTTQPPLVPPAPGDAAPGIASRAAARTRPRPLRTLQPDLVAVLRPVMQNRQHQQLVQAPRPASADRTSGARSGLRVFGCEATA